MDNLPVPENSTGLKGPILKAIGMGFIVALALVVVSLAVPYLLSMISGADSGNENLLSAMGTISAMVTLLLYALILFGPAVWVGFKHGWKATFLVLISEVVWLIVAVFVLYLAALHSPQSLQSMPEQYPNNSSLQQGQ